MKIKKTYRVFANKMDYAILPKSRGFTVNRMVKTLELHKYYNY